MPFQINTINLTVAPSHCSIVHHVTTFLGVSTVLVVELQRFSNKLTSIETWSRLYIVLGDKRKPNSFLYGFFCVKRLVHTTST